MNYLIQPKKYKSLMADEGSKAIMDKTIVFFENMGKQRLLDDYNKKIWYREFIDFLARERIFFKLLTPKQYAEGDPDVRWDTARNSEYSEIAGLLRAGILVLLPGDHIRLGPHLDEPQREGQEKGCTAAQGRRHLRLRSFRAHPRRRHLLHRDHVDPQG